MRDHQGLPFEMIGDPQFLDNGAGGCKSSFSTPATHLANGTFVVVWFEQGEGPERGQYCIWDAGRGRLLRVVRRSLTEHLDLRISGDGSRLFALKQSRSIQAWSTQTGENIGHILASANMNSLEGFLIVHGSKVWCPGPGNTGWDFGDPRIPPFPRTASPGSPSFRCRR